jgi:hypothetical protein
MCRTAKKTTAGRGRDADLTALARKNGQHRHRSWRHGGSAVVPGADLPTHEPTHDLRILGEGDRTQLGGKSVRRVIAIHSDFRLIQKDIPLYPQPYPSFANIPFTLVARADRALISVPTLAS